MQDEYKDVVLDNLHRLLEQRQQWLGSIAKAAAYLKDSERALAEKQVTVDYWRNEIAKQQKELATVNDLLEAEMGWKPPAPVAEPTGRKFKDA